jgi:hypothetical protein
MERNKKIILYSVMFIITGLIIELLSQIAFRIEYGYWIFHKMERRAETFNIRDFNQRVNDERTFTLRPNYKNDHYGESENNKGYPLYIDEYGFRSGTHKTNKKCLSIIFLGDSVPFGWGVGNSASIPSKFYNHIVAKNDSRCVINAAAPSYSLFQAIGRYEKEIYKQMPVDTIYLQIYDPASQVVITGKDWHPNQNWAMGRIRYDVNSDISIGKYGATMFTIFDVLSKIGMVKTADTPVRPLDLKDDLTISRFRSEVRKGLEKILLLAEDSKARRIVLAPLTIPKSGWDNLTTVRKMMINIQNKELLEFSKSHNNVEFLDTIKLLNSYKESDVFIDQCCHLSEKGNEVVAEALFDLIN